MFHLTQFLAIIYLSDTNCLFIPNRSLDRICLDLLLPSCFLPALVRLPASALSLHLDVARYAFDETSAHLLNNRTKSVKDSNDRFGFIFLLTTLINEKKMVSTMGNHLLLLFV